jgi:hypothetical protein
MVEFYPSLMLQAIKWSLLQGYGSVSNRGAAIERECVEAKYRNFLGKTLAS